MELVIDANILVAAFLKAATTRNLLIDPRLKLFSPEHLLLETQEVLLERLTKRTKNFGESDFEELFHLLTEYITVLPMDAYRMHISRAGEIAPHEEDAPYLACCLHLGIPLWSNDLGMKEQSMVRVFSTNELLSELARL